jgi:hypothetical protein
MAHGDLMLATVSGRRGIAAGVLRVTLGELRLLRSMPRPMSASAILTPAAGMLTVAVLAVAALRPPSRTVAEGPTWGAQVAAGLSGGGSRRPQS